MTTLAELKEQAYSIGLTDDEVKQHGRLNVKQTWIDAIDYTEQFQVETDSEYPAEVNEDKDNSELNDFEGLGEDVPTDEEVIEEIKKEKIKHGDLVCHKDDVNTIYKVIGDTVYNSDNPRNKIGYKVNPLEVHCKPLGYSSDDATPYIDFTIYELVKTDLEEIQGNDEFKIGDTVQHHPSNRVFKVADIIPDINGFILVKSVAGTLMSRFHPSSLKKIESPSAKEQQSERIYDWTEVMGNNMVYPTLVLLYREVILTRNTKLIKEGRNGVYRPLKIRYDKDFIVWRLVNVLREYDKDDIPKLKEVFEEVLKRIEGTKEDEI